MFTGIIECIGKITAIVEQDSNIHFTIQSPISSLLHIDQSVAHDGVCLTVTHVHEDTHQVTAIAETLRMTALNTWKIGTEINIERCMPANGRFDGHIVQGHVDTIATSTEIENAQGSWYFTFGYDSKRHENLIVHKGSVCINGISLTVSHVGENWFKVAIIPYTYEHTNIHRIQKGSTVNIEFDIIGKYIAQNLKNRL
ncbi:MAG: riboflavin synthase [Bacteroidota bacterium]|jgi:riboflavin synthase